MQSSSNFICNFYFSSELYSTREKNRAEKRYMVNKTV